MAGSHFTGPVYSAKGFVGPGRVDVVSMATGGAGTQANPWTGWDTAITWTPNVKYEFAAGYYSYASAPPDWNQDNMILMGTADTVLRCTGVGPVMYFDAGTSGTVGKTNLCVGPFILEGNGTTTQKGLWLRSVNRSKFYGIRVRGVTQYGIHQNFGVLNEFYMPIISGNMDTGYVLPSTHFCIDSLTSTNTYYSSSTNVYNPIIEANKLGIGIQLINHAYSTQFFGGTSEGMGVGVEIGNDIYSGANACAFNSFYGLDFEANANYDAYVKNSFNAEFHNCTFFSSINTVNITGSNGQFSCISGSLYVGQAIVVSGANSGSGIITGYTNPTTYYVIATNGSTTFTLSASVGGAAISTTAGSTTGLFFGYSNVTVASGASFTKFFGGQNTNAIYDGGLGTQFDNHAFVAANYTNISTGDLQWNRCRDFATSRTLNFNPPVVQYTNSVTGTITVATGTDILILDGSLAGTLTVALPAYIDMAGGGALNPQFFKLCSTGTITTVTFTDPKGRTVPANLTGTTAVTAGSSYTFYYGAAGFKWIRIG